MSETPETTGTETTETPATTAVADADESDRAHVQMGNRLVEHLVRVQQFADKLGKAAPTVRSRYPATLALLAELDQ